MQYQNVDGGSGGTRTLVFRYALDPAAVPAPPRTGHLVINGVSQNITFTATANWDTWANVSVTVVLNPGATNTIELQSTGQDLANQDQLTVH